MRWPWQRLAALAGIAAVVLWIVSVIIQGEPPEEENGGAAGAGEDVLRWYNDETGTILAGGFISQIGVLFFLIFLTALRLRLGGVEGGNGFLTLLASGRGSRSRCSCSPRRAETWRPRSTKTSSPPTARSRSGSSAMPSSSERS